MSLNKKFIGLFLYFLLQVQISIQQSDPVVQTSLGAIRGTTQETAFGKKIYSFRGIPYTKPPINELRFKAPVPVDKWNETYDATSDSLICPQTGIISYMSEDCLKLNVHSVNLNGSAPVLVYIHGGANVLGSGNSLFEAGPQYLLDYDVVLVSFNYRLGALGFMSTSSEDAPGNFGYLDQVLALKWVQEHIHNFGGNPNSVTIFGLSAGSMAVTLHMASKLSTGLFHRAIAMSGSATNTFDIDNLFWTRKLARELSCPLYNPKDIVECLRTVDWKDIVSVCSRWEPYGFVNMKWNYEIDNIFLSQHPTSSFMSGNFNKVPLIAGITKDELDFSLYGQENNTNLLNDLGISFDLYAPELFLFGFNDNNNNNIAPNLRKFYLNDNLNISVENFVKFGEIFSDSVISHSVHRLVELASYHTDVYYYRMDYVGKTSLYLDHMGNPRGVGHGDDLRYVMPGSWYGPQFQNDDVDMMMVNRTVQLWTSFARNSTPIADDVQNWETARSSHDYPIACLYNNKTATMNSEPYKDRFALWDSLFPINSGTVKFGDINIYVILTTLISFLYNLLK